MIYFQRFKIIPLMGLSQNLIIIPKFYNIRILLKKKSQIEFKIRLLMKEIFLIIKIRKKQFNY